MRGRVIIGGALVGISFLACGSDTAEPVSPRETLPDTATVGSLELAPAAATITSSGRLDVTATVKAIDGSPLKSRSVGWTTSDPAIASVTVTGPQSAVVLAVAAGSATIAATVDGSSATLSLAVVPPMLTDRAFVWSESAGMRALEPLPDATSSHALAVNDVGVVAGSSVVGLFSRAVRWLPSGAVEDLSTASGTRSSQANGINNSGQIVGWVINTTGSYRAFLWKEGGGMTDIGALPGDRESVALAINDSGVVVGFSSSAQGRRPFRWTTDRGMEAIVSLPAFSAGTASAISDAGVIVGHSGNDAEDYFNKRATLWKTDGSATELGPCVKSYDGDSDCLTLAYGINHLGDVVGRMQGSAVRWVRGGNVSLLSTLPGVKFGEARAINNAGTVVGYVNYDDPLAPRAFAWTEAGGMRDLGALPGRRASIAYGINSSGQIVGYSR